MLFVNRTKNSNKFFRFTGEMKNLLEETAERTGLSQTEVVEYCLKRYAAVMERDLAAARELLSKHMVDSVSAEVNSSKKVDKVVALATKRALAAGKSAS